MEKFYVSFEEIFVGMEVIDTEGVKGIVTEADDIHNIYVISPDATGLYCLDENCESYDPLFKI